MFDITKNIKNIIKLLLVILVAAFAVLLSILNHTDANAKKKPDGLKISEVIASNSEYNARNGKHYDMVELVNFSKNSIFLGQYYISDSKKNLTDYRLPRVYIKPGEAKVFYFIGSDNTPKNAYEIPKGLKSSGEKVYLASKDGEIVDKIEYENLPENVSFGLSKKGKSYRYFTNPSFGKKNKGGYKGICKDPTPTVAPGSYKTGFTMKFDNKNEDVYYTTDGTKPTTSSKKYNGEKITISKNASIRAITRKKGYIGSKSMALCYFIGQPKYELDIVAVTMPSYDFSKVNTNYNSRTKYAANISLYSKGKLEFTEDCGITAQGCTSREYDKRSYRIKFSKSYGAKNLKYKVFDELDIDKFDSLVLRSGSQDNASTMLRDEFVTSLSRKKGGTTEVLSQAYKPVNLYVNGEYRGLYFLREHIDQHMIADHLGGKADDATLIKQLACEDGKDGGDWTSLWNYVKNHDLSSSENYKYVKSRVSLESVADYYITQIWAGNIDPDNVRICKMKDGKWHYVLFDLDLSLYGSGKGNKSKLIGTYNPGAYTYNALVYKLLKNSEFVKLWNSRAKTLLNGVLSDKTAKKHLNKMVKLIDHDMKYNCEKWASHKDSSGNISYRSYDGWKSSIADLKSKLTGRAQNIKNEIFY